MSAEDNKSIILRWLQAFNERDWATEAAYRAPDYVAYLAGAPGPLDGAGWDGFMSAFSAGLPDAQISVEAMVAERDLVASRWTITGTHSGTFQGVPATGRQVTMAGIEISRVVDGKIVEHWAQFDVLGVLQQIGALPVAA
ncbi:MAG TPA: ester cyclase [Chloroflexota bacterium]|jgi:steroid delta-isomerase-like uncharacterized protein|nr:ester cyclase [Chloroflexota bacterium]